VAASAIRICTWPMAIGHRSSPITKKKPLILGHEITGRVVEKRSIRQSVWNSESAVGVPWVHWTCGECEFCREGNEKPLCETTKSLA